MNSRLTIVALCLVSAALLFPVFAFQNQQAAVPYAQPFGDSPFAPSRALAEFKGFLSPSDFPSAAYCGKCHEDVHKQWRQSAHSNSFRAPFYLKNVQILIDEKGIEYSRHCEGCHNPIALLSGALSKGSQVNRSFDADGITCSVCHSITRLQSPTGTGSYVMGKPAVMVNEDGTPRAGLPSFDDILKNPELHKRAVMRDFYRTPEFCAACHKAAIPQQLNGYKWLRAFSVYDEWQQSSWSRQTPLPFYKKDKVYICQDCHMPPVEFKSDYGGKDGKLASHRFPGANTAIPEFYSYPEQMETIRQFLHENLAMNFFALTRQHGNVTQEVMPLGVQELTISPGDDVTVDLVIQNTKIGHGLVPEQRDFYESWVEFTAQTKDGRTLYHSGGLDRNGLLDPQAHTYTNRLIDRSGKRLVRHQVWQTRLKTYDNTIMSGRSDLVRYRFRVPATARGEIHLAAKVNYRRFRKQYTTFILKRPVDYPVVELGTAEFTLKIGKNLPSPEEDPKRTLLRWNNYGIALLGQQQWWKAAEAFAHTTEMDPSYLDGYVNQAVAEYSKWIESRKENPDGPGVFSLDNANAPPAKFSPALELLEKALGRQPEYARALFYKGLILRLQNHLDDAARELAAAARQYPNFRQAHQELGYVLYLKKDFGGAAEQFEAVKRINPDDVTACYYLSISYARLGKPEQAQENATLYAQHRDDPNNFALNLEYVQRHRSEARELTPYHAHR